MSLSPTHSAGSRAALAACFASLVVGTSLACGTSEPTNPLPTLTGVTPAGIVVGSDATTLTLSGTGFVPGSQVRWNDADRVTHFQSAQALTVDLPASDLASVKFGKLTVVNGPPGGGISDSLDVPVGYPVPQITALSPATVPIQSGNDYLSIDVTGSGFVPQSYVLSGTTLYAVSYLSPTRLSVLIGKFTLGTPGTRPLTVVNPGPGGGTSNAIDFGVAYPVPTLALASPDTSLVGAAFTLTVTGTGFGVDSRVQWNGQDRPTTFVSATKLTADISATDVGSPAVVTLAVRNPAPGGGTSSPLPYRVVEPAPMITGVSPGFVNTGSGATTITITGTNFRPGATAQWNGANRSATLVSGTTITMTLTATDVATPQTGKLTVTNPGASGTSNAMGVIVVSTSPSLAVDRTVMLTNADVVYDPLRKVLYASVPSTAGQYANEIVRIDPASGAVTGEVSVGNNPATLAITDDGQFLYVGLRGAPRIARVVLATLTRDTDILLQADGLFGGRYAEDIQPIPGAPKTIAVSTFFIDLSPSSGGTFLFNDGAQLPASDPFTSGAKRLTRGPDASRIYGINDESPRFGLLRMVVAADGIRDEMVQDGVLNDYGADIEYDAGFIYGTTGEVVSVPAMSLVGTIPMTGYVRPDASNARVHFLNRGSIYTYHYTQFTRLGSFSDPSLAGHTRLIRWGTDGLALGGGATIVLLRGALVAP